MFVSAADFFTSPMAAMKRRGNRRSLMGKFSTARCVCGPYSASAGTFISPSESLSILYSSLILPPRWERVENESGNENENSRRGEAAPAGRGNPSAQG